MAANMIWVLVFAVLYAIKGGSGNLIPNWEKVRATNAVTERLMDGKVLSTVLLALIMFIPDVTIIEHVLVTIMWLVSVAPSMGEEHGAVGRWKHAWGQYIDYGFGRMYGVKKAIQRGVFIGACMALATGFTPYICFSLLFVPAIFIGQELSYRILKKDGWTIAEPIIGALVYGIPTALWLCGT